MLIHMVLTMETLFSQTVAYRANQTLHAQAVLCIQILVWEGKVLAHTWRRKGLTKEDYFFHHKTRINYTTVRASGMYPTIQLNCLVQAYPAWTPTNMRGSHVHNSVTSSSLCVSTHPKFLPDFNLAYSCVCKILCYILKIIKTVKTHFMVIYKKYPSCCHKM